MDLADKIVKYKNIKEFHIKNDLIKIIFKKSCGYEFLLTFMENETVSDIYKKINCLYPQTSHQNWLYLSSDQSFDDLISPSDENIKKFCINRIPPEFPVPHELVYKLYFNDGGHPPNRTQ